MRPDIRRMELPEDRRILVTSDVHGHWRYLQKLLEKADFSAGDILFLVGDIIEKGPESLKTLRYVMELCERYTVYPLMGNVDFWRLRMLEQRDAAADEQLLHYLRHMKRWYGGCFFTDFCTEAGLPAETPAQVAYAKTQIRQSCRHEIAFLRALPTVIETQKYLFVHAGLPTADFSRLGEYDAFDFLKRDAFLEEGLFFKKYVIVGHWPVMLYGNDAPQANPLIDRERKIISIDGGCGIKDDGQLNLLMIPAGSEERFLYESCDGLPAGTALTAQPERAATVFVKWTDNAVDILAKNEEFIRVRHRTSRKIFEIPANFLLEFGGETRCGDYTDYRIGVEAGERLSLVSQNSKGYFVKKNGRSGWYYGEIIPE